MKNKLTDLHDYLFMQLERLSDEDLKGEQLQEEINRADAITAVSTTIVKNAALILQGQKYYDNAGGMRNKAAAKILIGNNND